MRIAALILGILGGLAAGFLGFKWNSDAQGAKDLMEAAAAAGADMSELNNLVNASYVLMAGLVAGIVGGVMSLKGMGKIGGLIMVVFAVVPAVWAPKALVFTSILIVAGILGLMSKPKTA